jgi:murein DD-endopeptidase MepM/ murein hydrolase activator NlpD
MIPDGEPVVCVHVPGDDEGAPAAPSGVNAHRDPRGRWVLYDQIPRRPDRPADYDAYRYPVPCDRACVVSGYDLDRPDDLQRRGRRLRQVGHGAIDISQPRGTPVAEVPLEHQQGDTEIVYVGPLFGTSVVTRHTVHEGGQPRDYLVILGHLDSVGAGVETGAHVQPGAILGFVGDTGSPGLVHLHIEVRRVRPEAHVDPAKTPPAALVGEATIVCDPRNVLPLR